MINHHAERDRGRERGSERARWESAKRVTRHTCAQRGAQVLLLASLWLLLVLSLFLYLPRAIAKWLWVMTLYRHSAGGHGGDMTYVSPCPGEVNSPISWSPWWPPQSRNRKQVSIHTLLIISTQSHRESERARERDWEHTNERERERDRVEHLGRERARACDSFLLKTLNTFWFLSHKFMLKLQADAYPLATCTKVIYFGFSHALPFTLTLALSPSLFLTYN